jgi:hypothetical protein
MPMHYCSSSVGTSTDSTKSVSGHVTPTMCFHIRCDLRVKLCILVQSGCETSTHYFSYSGETGTESGKSAPRHVTPNLCFFIQWDLRVK